MGILTFIWTGIREAVVGWKVAHSWIVSVLFTSEEVERE